MGWSTITVPSGHLKAALVLYSQTDDLGDESNELPTSAMGNVCFGAQDCNWTIVTRTGPVTLVPKRTVVGANATYRLTAIAQTTSGDMGAQSIILRQGLTAGPLEAGEWLVPPANVATPLRDLEGREQRAARDHRLQFRNKRGRGPQRGRTPDFWHVVCAGLADGADFDVNDFSLEDDSDLLWGISIQPATIP